jgi:hypothetical protein
VLLGVVAPVTLTAIPLAFHAFQEAGAGDCWILAGGSTDITIT